MGPAPVPPWPTWLCKHLHLAALLRQTARHPLQFVSFAGAGAQGPQGQPCLGVRVRHAWVPISPLTKATLSLSGLTYKMA